jgi:hypothetical protein
MRRTLTALVFAIVVVALGSCGGQRWTLSSPPIPESVTTTSIANTTTTESPSVGETTTPTTLPPYDESDAAAGNGALFDSNRAQLEMRLRAQPDPKLTVFSFDASANMVRVVFVSEHPAAATRTRLDAFAWQVGATLAATFWFPELLQTAERIGGSAVWLPRLRIQIDQATYLCPSSAQIAMAGKGLSLSAWLAQCRG